MRIAHENDLDNPEFQALIRDAMKTLDYAAQCSDDNRLEAHYKRDGIKMIVTVEECNNE